MRTHCYRPVQSDEQDLKQLSWRHGIGIVQEPHWGVSEGLGTCRKGAILSAVKGAILARLRSACKVLGKAGSSPTYLVNARGFVLWIVIKIRAGNSSLSTMGPSPSLSGHWTALSEFRLLHYSPENYIQLRFLLYQSGGKQGAGGTLKRV